MNVDGTGVTRLTNISAIEGFAAWSPTGAKLAFSSTREGNSEIYVMNADETGVTRLTNHSKIDGNENGTGVVRLTNHSSWDPSPHR